MLIVRPSDHLSRRSPYVCLIFSSVLCRYLHSNKCILSLVISITLAVRIAIKMVDIAHGKFGEENHDFGTINQLTN